MFVSDTHLEQVLAPEAYWSDDWYARERHAVLLPAWWAVAMTQQFQKDGDFLTLDHVGGPVILRRNDGIIRAYRNVCAHRLAKLTDKPFGHCDFLRCEYHGWEYGDDGTTRKIPDAPSFRPLEKGQLGLDVLPVATVGSIVFISFAASPPSIEEWLAGEAADLEQDCKARDALLWVEDVDVPVNWKIVVENNLESYHVGTVHANTLGACPDEMVCDHQLGQGSSRFEAPGDESQLGAAKRWLAGRLGRPTSGRYLHAHVHPAFMRVKTDLGAGFQSVVPTGPRTCRIMFRSVVWQSGEEKTLWNGVARFVVRRFLRSWKKIIAEDLAIMPQVQMGLQSPHHPGQGLISRREERLVHFQRWVLNHMQRQDTHDSRCVSSVRVGGV